MDKNEFRYLEDEDLVTRVRIVEYEEKPGLIRSVVEFIKEEVRELWSLVK
jgi:hypothetical protein